MAKTVALKVKRLNDLTLLRLTFDGYGPWDRVWECRCVCGKKVEVIEASLTRRDRPTRSCGCAKKRAKYPHKHGKHRTRTYWVWAAMRQRCNNPKNVDYKHYGGRGIKVCDRWAWFENFLADMGEAPEGLTLDRKNNNGDYSPENCRWASWQVQRRNRRDNKEAIPENVC